MPNFFAKRDPWGNGLALWVFAGLLFFVPLIFSAMKQLKTDNNVQNWLPEDDPQARVLSWAQSHFPAEDRILVTWDGSSLTDPRVDRLKSSLAGQVDEDGVRRGGSPYVEAVTTARDVCTAVVEYNVDPDEVLRRMQGTLVGTGLIKVRLTSAGRTKRAQTIEALKAAAADQIGLTVRIEDPTTEFVDDELLAEWENDAESDLEEGEEALFDGELPAHDFRVSWNGLGPHAPEVEAFCRLARNLRGFETAEEPDGQKLVDDCFVSLGSPVGMLVTLSEAGSSDSAAMVADVRSAAAAAGIPLDSLHLGGSAVTTAELNKAMKQATWNGEADSWMPHKRSVMLLSFTIGIVLAFYFLKSARLGILVLGISFYTTAITVTLVPLTGGTMNMVLIVMPTLLNVLALSGAIHVANYWRHAAHENPATAIVRAVEMARQPCVLASLTTAVGLISLVTSDLAPVRDFGIYSAIGCVIALFMVLYGLPTLLQLWPASRPDPRHVESRSWGRFGDVVTKHATLISLSCLFLFVTGTAGLTYFRTETKVIRYFPASARLVKDTESIERSLSGVASVETIVRFNADSQDQTQFLERMEIVREVEKQISDHPEISGSLSLADFQPVRLPPIETRGFKRIAYNRRSSEAERRIKEENEGGASQFLSVAHEAVDLHQTGDEGLNAAGDELWRITAQAAVASDSDYGLLTRQLNERVQSVLRMHPGATHVVTGTIPLFLRTQQAVLDSLVMSFALAFGLIAVVMMILLRNPVAGLIAMLPNLMPVGTVFGLISWCGQHVDVGSMVTASVALGIAVDGTLHLLSWFREGVGRGLSRGDAVKQALGHCGPAMWQTSATVGISLFMLAPAELLLVSRFGWLMASLIGAALVADVIFLPALLVGPLGRLIERSVCGKQTAEAAAAQSSDTGENARTILRPPRPHFGLTKQRSKSSRKTV